MADSENLDYVPRNAANVLIDGLEWEMNAILEQLGPASQGEA